MLETSTQIPVSTIIYMDKTNIKNKLNESTILFNILKYYEMKDIEDKDIITNILLHLYFIKNSETLKLNEKYIKNDYDIVFNENNEKSLLNIAKNQFNFNLYIIDEYDFVEYYKYIIECKTHTFNNVLNDLMNCLKNNKKYNIFYKNISEHFTNIELIEYIVKLANPQSVEKIANLCSGSGNFFIKTSEHFKNKNESINLLKNMYGFEINEEVMLWSLLNIYISTKLMLNNNIIKSDIIHDNLFNDGYDLIFCDFPVAVRNIIHANCCSKIKNLKIRGTKSEPLILQLILNIMNKNGRAFLLVPDNLLYNESKQHIQTREYLLNNFCINKITSINKHYQNKEYRMSIMEIERKGKTNKINFTKLISKDNKLCEDKLNTIDVDTIFKNNCILWNEKYNQVEEEITSINLFKLGDLVNIIYDENLNEKNINSLSGNYLLFPIYCNDNKKVRIIFDKLETLGKDNMTLLVKDTSVCLQKFLNYYIEQRMETNILLYTSGKLNKIDIDKLNDKLIKIPSIKTQELIIKYFDLNNKLINVNKEQIATYMKLKENFIDLFNDKFDKIKIKDICSSIDYKPNKINSIMIQKNSNSAGTVSLSNETSIETTNIYYLNLKNNYNEKMMYHILKYNEKKLFNLANLNPTINLNKGNLENFEIQDYPIDIQEKIISQCDMYDKICSDLSDINKIVFKNIITEIVKIEKNNNNKSTNSL
jgi:hypothetical protein